MGVAGFGKVRKMTSGNFLEEVTFWITQLWLRTNDGCSTWKIWYSIEKSKKKKYESLGVTENQSHMEFHYFFYYNDIIIYELFISF
jgi:hypothetical protein